MILENELKSLNQLFIRQRQELAELFGFETRNKYSIENSNRQMIAFAAEQQKGIFGFMFRQALGHWRSFELLVFDANRNPIMRAVHPFRFYFQRIDVLLTDGQPIGAIERKFSILSKRFVVHDRLGRELLAVSSPIWKIWTFPFLKNGVEVAVVRKKWAGLLTEAFTDQDNFEIEFAERTLTTEEKVLIMVAGIFIDLLYFEAKARSRTTR